VEAVLLHPRVSSLELLTDLYELPNSVFKPKLSWRIRPRRLIEGKINFTPSKSKSVSDPEVVFLLQGGQKES
jgi:hypothetical protein